MKNKNKTKSIRTKSPFDNLTNEELYTFQESKELMNLIVKLLSERVDKDAFELLKTNNFSTNNEEHLQKLFFTKGCYYIIKLLDRLYVDYQNYKERQKDKN